jgi:hypothetical protein
MSIDLIHSQDLPHISDLSEEELATIMGGKTVYDIEINGEKSSITVEDGEGIILTSDVDDLSPTSKKMSKIRTLTKEEVTALRQNILLGLPFKFLK